MSRTIFGKWLRKARKAHNMTREQVAHFLGTDAMTIKAIEKGWGEFALCQARAGCDARGVDLERMADVLSVTVDVVYELLDIDDFVHQLACWHMRIKMQVGAFGRITINGRYQDAASYIAGAWWTVERSLEPWEMECIYLRFAYSEQGRKTCAQIQRDLATAEAIEAEQDAQGTTWVSASAKRLVDALFSEAGTGETTLGEHASRLAKAQDGIAGRVDAEKHAASDRLFESAASKERWHELAVMFGTLSSDQLTKARALWSIGHSDERAAEALGVSASELTAWLVAGDSAWATAVQECRREALQHAKDAKDANPKPRINVGDDVMLWGVTTLAARGVPPSVRRVVKAGDEVMLWGPWRTVRT